jgi:hypothetical protein
MSDLIMPGELDLLTALMIADDPDVELVDAAIDHNPDHGTNDAEEMEIDVN